VKNIARRFVIPVVLSFLIFTMMVSISFATPMIRVELPAPNSIDALIRANLDIAYRANDHAMIVGWPEDMDRLASCGLDWNVDIENVEEYYRSRLDNSLDEMGGYPTYDEIWAWALQITADHPDIVSGPDTLGYTLEGRPMWVIKISDNPGVDEDEPEVYINAAIHAREVITPMIAMNFADLLTDNYGSDARVDAIVNEREVWITPVINIDGYLYNEENDPEGGGMWRKNKRVVDGNIMGVDLNRNFPSMWGLDDWGSSPSPSAQTYRGLSPASEPETQVIMDFVNSRNFTLVMNYHSYTHVVYIPQNEQWQPPEEAATLITLAQNIFASIENWGVGWGGVSGGTIEWMENGADYHMFAFLPEVGFQTDGFWPSLERQPVLIAQHEEPLLRFCEVADQPHQFLNPVPPVISDAADTVATTFDLTWEDGDDPRENTPVAYDVIELQDFTLTHDFENPEFVPFQSGGFGVTDNDAYSGTYSFGCGSIPNGQVGFATNAEYTVAMGDTLVFMINYNIDPNDAIVVQGSNPYVTMALEGNITQPWDQGGQQFGHLIFGSSNGWVEARFPLTSFTMQAPTISMTYYSGPGGNEYFIYVDDFFPLPSFEQAQILDAGLVERTYTIEKPDLTTPELFNYRVRAIDAQNQYSVWSNTYSPILDPNTSGVGPTINVPMAFNVSPVFPNPFNPTAMLNVTLPEIADVSVVVYDILGRQVSWIPMGLHLPGMHYINLDGSEWASGVYFIKVEAKASNGEVFRNVQKASLLK